MPCHRPSKSLWRWRNFSKRKKQSPSLAVCHSLKNFNKKTEKKTKGGRYSGKLLEHRKESKLLSNSETKVLVAFVGSRKGKVILCTHNTKNCYLLMEKKNPYVTQSSFGQRVVKSMWVALLVVAAAIFVPGIVQNLFSILDFTMFFPLYAGAPYSSCKFLYLTLITQSSQCCVLEIE